MIAYFIDHETLETIDIIELDNYKLDIDEEVNNKSTLSISQGFSAGNNDYIVLKNKAIEYQGMIIDISNKKGFKSSNITLLDISNIFNRFIFLNNEDLIFNTGIEDFIKYTIENEFSNSSDAFINLEYIEVEALTHTPIIKKVSTEDGVYNFHTYITDAKQHYDINIDYVFGNNKLKIIIYKETNETQIIDTTVSDVIDYEEVIELKYTAKVTVKAKDTGLVKSWYLRSDRTITDDENDINRVKGDIKTAVCEEEIEMLQTATDVFKGNSFKHLIEFKIVHDSKLIEVDKLKIGTPIKIKTESGIYDSYISAKIIDSKSKSIYFKCGNLRVTLTDKLRKDVIR